MASLQNEAITKNISQVDQETIGVFPFFIHHEVIEIQIDFFM